MTNMSYRITIIKKDGGAITTCALDCTLKEAQALAVEIADRDVEGRIGVNAPVYIGRLASQLPYGTPGYSFYRLRWLRNNIERDNMTEAQKKDACSPPRFTFFFPKD